MPPQEEDTLTTVLFCRSSADGSIAPAWDKSRELELRGQFEVGLTVAGRYLLQRKLGDGAMGRVFLAKDLRLDRPVAMKVVSHRHPGANLEADLQREAKLGANLNHSGIAAVYDFGFHDNKSYTIFEYVEGETLRALMRRRGRFPLDETLQISRDLAAALDFAHVHGVVHRDLLNCLGDRDARLRFLAGIPSNILEKSDAVRACEEFNGLEPGTLGHFGEDSSDIFHPFRDLYYAGLLGVITSDAELGTSIQRFRRPHDSLAHSTIELPDSPVFLMHPALDTFIRAQRTRAPFLQFQLIPVGQSLVWEPYFTTLMQIERQLQSVDDRQFVDLTHQVVRRVQIRMNSGRTPHARIEVETSDEFRALCALASGGAGEEMLYWLEELLEEL